MDATHLRQARPSDCFTGTYAPRSGVERCLSLLLSHMLSVASLPRMPISSVHFVHLLAYSSCWRGCIYLSAGLESPWETCSCRIACVCPLHPITTRGSGHQWHLTRRPLSWRAYRCAGSLTPVPLVTSPAVSQAHSGVQGTFTSWSYLGCGRPSGLSLG